MFGLSSLFATIKRLTTSINTSADLFDQANDQLRQRLAIDVPEEEKEPALLEHRPLTNGSGKPTTSPQGGRPTKARK